jgi:hypothetical protein
MAGAHYLFCRMRPHSVKLRACYFMFGPSEYLFYSNVLRWLRADSAGKLNRWTRRSAQPRGLEC